ncbi:MAG: SusD/RagB family nutrient-binding outer membrane lipoprotein [Ferruginibacter sp.]
MKSFKNISNLCLLVLVIFIANSCTKDFKDENTDPKLITEEKVTPELLLTTAEVNAKGGLGFSNAGDFCGMTTSDANLPFDDRFDDGAWNAVYTTIGNNLAAIIRKTESDPEMINKKSIARILKAWIFSEATDIYGDIPYFESNKSPENSIATPKYDSQKSIYEDIFKELKEAAAALIAGKPSYGNSDLIYGGDPAKWKKFANSLRLRLALRVRYVDAVMAKNNMTDLVESDLILSTDDEALFFTSNDNTSHWNGAYYNLVNYASGPETKDLIAKTVLDILSGGNSRNPIDPRIRIYADTAYASWPPTLNPPLPYFGYRGKPLLGGAVPVEEKYPYGAESTSRISDFWYVPAIEQPILRSSEVYFALAEAVLFGLRTGDANVYFKKGIMAGVSETQHLFNRTKDQVALVEKKIRPNWGSANINALLAHKEMKQSEIDIFLASPTTTLAGSTEEMHEQIMNQKIVALYPNSTEGWSEWRRTGYPRVLVTTNDYSGLKGVSYRRGHYPSVEGLINSSNYNEAIQRMGPKDDVLSKVWWDANPNAPHKHPGAVEWRATKWL